MKRSQLEDLIREIAEAFRAADPQPTFPYRVEWSDDYEGLLEGKFRAVADVRSLADESRRRGRVIVHAEGGSGKSTVIRRLFVEAAQERSAPILVDLGLWRKPMFKRWDDAKGNADVALETLLHEIGSPGVTESDLAALPSAQRRLVLVDGLNEIPVSMGAIALRALDTFAQRQPSGAVIVTDRLVRRDLPSDRWGIAHIRVNVEAVRAQLPGQLPIDLSRIPPTPFFLNWAVTDSVDTTSRSAAFKDFLQRHADLGGEALERTAKAAFDASVGSQVRSFPIDRFREIAGGQAVHELQRSGQLVADDNGQAYFKHHLVHDFLASTWFAVDSSLWINESFDALTFFGSSFDVLALTLEQIANRRDADLFVRRVYDWNYYGIAYAMAEAQAVGASKVSPWMETAMLAMLAERRWDVLKSTSQRVTDSLRLFRSEESLRFLSVGSLTELMRLLNGVTHSEKAFREWLRLFTMPAGHQVDDETVRMIVDEDSLIGWTVSNVLKRVEISAEGFGYLRDAVLRAENRTVRWRAAHALGGHPSAETVTALMAGLDDPDIWVRYGATRSIVECAVRNPRLRAQIFGRLVERVDQLRSDRPVIAELERALILRDPPGDWPEAVAPLVGRLWSSAESAEDQDRWRRLAFQIEIAVETSA